MNSLETNLKFVLDKLGIDPLIRSVEDIHKVQNAVYEESVNGIDLGLCFGDYPVGKFSPELRDIHIDLNNSLVIDE